LTMVGLDTSLTGLLPFPRQAVTRQDTRRDTPWSVHSEHRSVMRRTLITILLLLATACVAGFTVPAHAATAGRVATEITRVVAAHREPRRIVAAEYAASHERGCPYVWGGAGPCPDGFDCSGLVMVAYQHAGIDLPHNVAEMVMASGKLRWIPERLARRGDLAVYGSGWGAHHVALVWHAHGGVVRWLFAASTFGVPSGPYEARWFEPTAYYRVT
jgi:cell wall-associated NlpC family hydrolase